MGKRIDIRSIIGKVADALAVIILVEVGWLLRILMVVEQAAEQSQTDFVALAQQTIAVTAIKHTDCLQQQNGECDNRQLSFYFYEYHFMDLKQIFEKIKQSNRKCNFN